MVCLCLDLAPNEKYIKARVYDLKNAAEKLNLHRKSRFLGPRTVCVRVMCCDMHFGLAVVHIGALKAKCRLSRHMHSPRAARA